MMNSSTLRSKWATPFKLAIVVLSMALLAACASTQIYQRQLVRLTKGMSPQEASTSLQLPAASTHTTSVKGKAYTFQRYSLNNGLSSDVYLLCYEAPAENSQQAAPQLKYWGYIEEFRRYPDSNINQALENILPELGSSSK